MKIIDDIMGGLSQFVDNYKKRQREKALQEKITRNFKDLKIRRKLTKEQEKEVNDFYVSIRVMRRVIDVIVFQVLLLCDKLPSSRVCMLNHRRCLDIFIRGQVCSPRITSLKTSILWN